MSLELQSKLRSEQLFANVFTSEDRFRLLVGAVTDYAIYMLDPHGVVTSWNPGAERFKGYTESEILGQHFSRFHTEEARRAGVPDRALATAEAEGKFEAEGWRLRKDGSRFWAHVVIDPIRDPNGNLFGFAKITRDLTERRDAQERLEKAREALAQSQKMEAIGQLTGGVAHDFNNLLTAIMGSLELASKRIGDDVRLQRLIDNAMQGARRGAALTQRMLAFARTQELKPEVIDVVTLVDGMRDMLTRLLGAEIAVLIRKSSQLPSVLVDANQLEMAIINLAVNAKDAMPHGGPVTIDIVERELKGDLLDMSPGRYLRLSVVDRGHGMNAEILARAREPFFTTKGVGRGTGLGLSMVHGLAEQSGGRLVLESTPDEGTTASLWLPSANSPAVSEGTAIERSISTTALTILAVDDDPLVLFNTAAMLEDLGHQVTSAYSAKEAIEILTENRFDLVIVDYAMPSMTGAQFVEVVRNRSPDQPILLATGYAELPHEVVDVPRLSKPFMQQDLARAVTSAIGNAGAMYR